MKFVPKKLCATIVFAASLCLSIASFAQPAPNYAPDNSDTNGAAGSEVADPPSRVARLALINGAVSFVPAGETDWTEAQINRPLITGDKLWTDRGARAELEIGTAAIRVDEQSSFDFLNLDDQNVQVELTQGTLNLRVRRIYDNQSYEIDTPTLAFVINRVGEYRLDVAPDGKGTIVTAFHGGGDAYGEAGARFRIEEGQSVRFNDAQLRDYASNALPAQDDFDRFAFDRDRRWDNSPSRQFVSEEVIGYGDLDNNGTWDTAPEYGNVWYPSSVAAGWTPYSTGHWGWVGSYGWTWVDAAPWGFAPFHYGRWAYVGNRWGWCPGGIHDRPYYAPALVAFIGGGLRIGIGGPVGWFPLGPRDVYVPGYRVSHDYFNRINVNNSRISVGTVNNFYGNYQRGNVDYARINYANRNIAGAVTAVPGNVFLGARSIRGSAIAVNRETFANARVSGFAAIAPTRESLAFRGGRNAIAPPPNVVNRKIIAATRPPAPIAPFGQREALLQRDPGRALSANQLRIAPTGANQGAANTNQSERLRGTGRENVNVVTSTGKPLRGPVANAPGPIKMNVPTSPATGVQPNRNATQRNNVPGQGNEQTHVIASPNALRADGADRRTLPSAQFVRPNANTTPGQPSTTPARAAASSRNGDRPANNAAVASPNNNAPAQSGAVRGNSLDRREAGGRDVGSGRDSRANTTQRALVQPATSTQNRELPQVRERTLPTQPVAPVQQHVQPQFQQRQERSAPVTPPVQQRVQPQFQQRQERSAPYVAPVQPVAPQNRAQPAVQQSQPHVQPHPTRDDRARDDNKKDDKH